MIKRSRWKECEVVGMKCKRRNMMKLPQNYEMRWGTKSFERGKTGEDIRRDGGEMIGIKI